MTSIEERFEEEKKNFEKEMLDIYITSLEDCHYDTIRYRQMIDKHGGLDTAKKLLSSKEIQSGLDKLWEYHRLDLSVECLVLKYRDSGLFTESELKEAENRLRGLNYDVSKC